jgi:hypothetical protein
VNGFERAHSLIRALLNAHDDIEWRSRVLDLQGVVNDLQAENFALQKTNADLQQRIRELEDANRQREAREHDQEDFPLRAVDDGVYVRLGHARKDPGEPVHGLCPHCYDEERRSILEPRRRTLYRDDWPHLHCWRCRRDYPVSRPMAKLVGLAGF